MTQPSKTTSKLADSGNKPQIGNRGAAITAAAAPTAYTAVTDLTNPVTKTEGETMSAALAAAVLTIATNTTAINAAISALEAQGLIADN